MFKKYAYIILPLLLILQGCSVPNITSLMTGGSNDDDLLLNDVTLPPVDDKQAQNNDIPFEQKQNEEKEEGIQLSSNSAFLDIDSEGRTSPFVPYKERNLKYESLNFGDLPVPPEIGEMSEDLNKVITAKVTGIVFDDRSPSALVNVLDNDYLVKPGDKIESFEIATITKDYVGIKTGSNIYRAKVGDIVDGEMHDAGVYNVGHRFAGVHHPARKEDIIIVKTKSKDDNKGETENFNDLSLPPIPELNTILPKVKINKDNIITNTNNLPAPPIPQAAGNSTKTDTN